MILLLHAYQIGIQMQLQVSWTKYWYMAWPILSSQPISVKHSQQTLACMEEALSGETKLVAIWCEVSLSRLYSRLAQFYGTRPMVAIPSTQARSMCDNEFWEAGEELLNLTSYALISVFRKRNLPYMAGDLLR